MATTTPRPAIEALDDLAEQTVAHIKFLTQQITAYTKFLAAIELDRLQQAHDVTDGRLAEQRHLLDADPDTAVPLPGIPHPKEAS
ncbi:hypothetical protein [Streptomyces rimosus]|uniref:hypothetical protein n=1 Tax=Streptomyces rimosus TaxID=1927 RepID=UPI0004CB7036|nr:hypothetical protein [Streptomyces rimosus]